MTATAAVAEAATTVTTVEETVSSSSINGNKSRIKNLATKKVAEAEKVTAIAAEQQQQH